MLGLVHEALVVLVLILLAAGLVGKRLASALLAVGLDLTSPNVS